MHPAGRRAGIPAGLRGAEGPPICRAHSGLVPLSTSTRIYLSVSALRVVPFQPLDSTAFERSLTHEKSGLLSDLELQGLKTQIMDGSVRTKLSTVIPAADAAGTNSPVEAAYAAAAAVSARLASAAQHTDLCVVCLQPCTSKACSCSFMHEQCAASYASTYGDASCRICSTAL